MNDGRSVSARAAASAAVSASTSSESATRCTCHPSAARRARWFSPSKEIAVLPSIVMRLSSYTTVNLPSPKCPAIEAASWLIALHHVAVGADRIGVVVHHRFAGAVVALGEEALGHRHPHRVGEALPERPGGDLHAGGVPALGVPRGARAPLAELLQVLERELVAAEVQQRVQQHARVPGAQHEAVAVAPGGLRGFDAQHALEQHIPERCERHRRAGVPGVRLLHRVHRQAPDRVDRRRCGSSSSRAVHPAV